MENQLLPPGDPRRESSEALLQLEDEQQGHVESDAGALWVP